MLGWAGDREGGEVRAWKTERTGSRRDKRVVRPCEMW